MNADFRPDLVSEPVEPVKKFNMRKTVVIESEEDPRRLKKKAKIEHGSDDGDLSGSDENDSKKNKNKGQKCCSNGVTRFKERLLNR